MGEETREDRDAALLEAARPLLERRAAQAGPPRAKREPVRLGPALPGSLRARVLEAARAHEARQAQPPTIQAQQRAHREHVVAQLRAEHDVRRMAEAREYLLRCGAGRKEVDLLLAGKLDVTYGMVRPARGLPYSALTEARAWWKARREDGADERFLMLVGGNGTGKTLAALDVAWRMRFEYVHPDLGTTWCWPLALPDSPLFIQAPDVARGALLGEDGDTVRRRMSRAGLLVLDELGREWPGDVWLSLVQDVINERYRHGRPTILCTNMDEAAFFERYKAAVQRRVEDYGRIVNLGKLTK